MQLSRCRILIVEDDYLIAEHIADVVRSAGGLVVGPYASLFEALSHLDDRGAIDGAILDINLAEQSSFPLAQALQSTRIPFLFLTGMERRDLPTEFARASYVQKPFQPAALVQLLVDCGIEPA